MEAASNTNQLSGHPPRLPQQATPQPRYPAPQSLAARITDGLALGILDARVCAWWLVARLHPNGPACPHCSNSVHPDSLPRWRELRTLRCTSCGRKFSARTGTILHGANLAPTQIVLMALLLGLRQSNQTIAKLAGCSDETVRQWRERLI
jgi:transposase-like protein